MEKIINIRVEPRSSREKVIEMSKDKYKVYTHKPAANGEANNALIELVADYFRVKKNTVSIVKGAKVRDKVVKIEK